ncbi:glutathione S-transferase C-terminal-like protein [Dichomitus squalens LYAD-421 SS1]|uniref:glutathione transferase n=1 Tax=Dichomitus squalens (strain LYAD-421) TaxID=732165 RepID=R7SWW3_DICSQ|nr:glutathione S-transferase C-terminal-like protein [Dichomitus squalens LYAD-421 SS1]EJF60576.1 glutathione S-transferase C-terminal-like protein [Dichomitus squalens LYAD-421 SS1]
MVLKLYGNPHSTCTQRVRTVLEELSVPYELVVIELQKGEHKSPEFVAIQPFGQVPYIDDDGFKLFESRAIARYLALKNGGVDKIIPDPKNLQKFALFEQGASIEQSNFDPSVSALAFENVFKPLLGQKTDPATVEKHKTTLAGKLAGYEALLSRQKYIGGDELTIVDIFHLPYGALLKVQGIDLLESDKYPNVKRWWAELTSRPSWKKVSGQ